MRIFELRDKVAVVTGGGKGIGAATVELFLEAGAKVAVFDLDPGTETEVLPVICDVTDEAQVEGAFERVVGQFGGVDVLVNNAGVAVRKPALELDIADWHKVMDLNLMATFLCSRVAARYMQKRRNDGLPRGGAIVNLASIMGFSGGIFPNASYQASKGGVVNLTRALALEWASHDIRVNAVAPTFVKTDLTVPIFSNPEVLQDVMRHTPLGALPDVDDVAAAILYLASPAARRVTGVTLPVDSGYLAR